MKNKIVAKNTRSHSNLKTHRDYSYDKAYESTPARKKYRAELNRVNRKKGTYGNGDGKDVSHTTKKGYYVMEKAASNRARNGHGSGHERLKKIIKD